MAPDVRADAGPGPYRHLAKKIWERHFPFQGSEIFNLKKNLHLYSIG